MYVDIKSFVAFIAYVYIKSFVAFIACPHLRGLDADLGALVKAAAPCEWERISFVLEADVSFNTVSV